MEYFVIGAVIVFLAVLYSAHMAAKSRVWIVHIRDGSPRLVKGKIAQSVVAELGDVLRRHGIRRGALYGLNKRGKVTLGFSRSIPPGSRQALRNVWSMHAR